MSSIRAYALPGPAPVAPGTPKMVELNGTAKALKVMAPWAGISGDGTAGDPMLAPLAEIVSIIGEGAVMDNDGGGLGVFAYGLTADQCSAIWDAVVQDVGSAEQPDALKTDVAYSLGALDTEFNRRRDIIAASARRVEIVIDPVATVALSAHVAVGQLPQFMVNGLMFEKNSLATPSGDGLSLYSFLVYFAPDLYSQGGFHDPQSVGVTSLRRLSATFSRWVDERTGDPNYATTMSDQELSSMLRDFVERLRLPAALRGHAPPGLTRLAQLTALLMRLRSIEHGVKTHCLEEVKLLPIALDTALGGHFLLQLRRILNGCNAQICHDSLLRLARAAGWADPTPSLQLAEQIDTWLYAGHRATLDTATGDAAAKITAVEKACVDKASRAAQMAVSAPTGRSAATAAADASIGAVTGPAVTRLSKTDQPALEQLMTDGRFPRAARKVEAVADDASQPAHAALLLAVGGATAGHSDAPPFALLVQIGWNHMSASALSITSKLGNIHSLHPRMLGAIVGTLVHPEHVHLLCKQLAKEFTCNDWGNCAAKSADKSFINFVAAQNHGERAKPTFGR